MILKNLTVACKLSAVLQGVGAFLGASHRRNFFGYSRQLTHVLPRRPPVLSAEEALRVLKSGDVVYTHGLSATPLELVTAMAERAKEDRLQGVTLCHILLTGEGEPAQPQYQEFIRTNNFFIGSACRQVVQEGKGDYVPCFLHQNSALFSRGIVQPDVCLVTVSPPDEHGFCSLGTCVEVTAAALAASKHVIGLSNRRMPRTFGDSVVHVSHLDALVEADRPLVELPARQSTAVDVTIGRMIAEELVQEGATLQLGIGTIPDVVLRSLKEHRNLGIHSEMLTEGMVDLIEEGNVTNSKKAVERGRVVGSFAFGGGKLYSFLHDNPLFVMYDCAFVNNPAVIARNPRVTAINSCVEIDLSGQVVADSVDGKLFSGFGGQVDFLSGAALSESGLPILAMPSTARGKSRIVKQIREGVGVVSTRAHVHYVVTEHGIAHLYGKNLRQRAYEMIRIAHPRYREQLEKDAFDILKCMPSP